MARNILSRIILQGKLVAQSPLHVGGYGEEVDTDLPLARDGAGRLYVPGTSLAGALRQSAEELFGPEPTDRLWGFQENDDRGHASFVFVEDAEIDDVDKLVIEIRDHVGIDRQFGSAAEHIKYDRAIVPRGAKLNLRVTVESATARKDELATEGRTRALAMLAALKQALEEGRIRLGAAKTRGLGYLRLEQGRLTEQRYDTCEGLFQALENADGFDVSQSDIEEALKACPPRKMPRIKLVVRWRPLGPLMVKSGVEGVAADMLPLVSGCNGSVALVLPGSSIKGALRSRAECIVRTVLNRTAPSWLQAEGKRKFLDAVKVELVNELFGAAGEKTEKKHSPAWLPGRGALAARDCFGQQKIARKQWLAIESAENDQAMIAALESAGLKTWTEAYHVAIDRWLGSAAESMLYTVLEPHSAAWEPLELEVDLNRLPNGVQAPAVALLMLLVRDLSRGRIPLGFATHRGMGAVEVEDVQLEISGDQLAEPLKELADEEPIILRKGQLGDLPEGFKRRLTDIWQQWIDNTSRATSNRQSEEANV